MSAARWFAERSAITGAAGIAMGGDMTVSRPSPAAITVGAVEVAKPKRTPAPRSSPSARRGDASGALSPEDTGSSQVRWMPVSRPALSVTAAINAGKARRGASSESR